MEDTGQKSQQVSKTKNNISTAFRAAGSQHAVRTISLDTATGQCGWLFGV
jgi:hypothetical protein